MASHDLYSSLLTPSEEALGFQLIQTTNPSKTYITDPEEIQIVIYQLGESDRIVKMQNPNGIIMYLYQRYGTVTRLKTLGINKAKWNPTEIKSTDPNDAIRLAKANMEKEEIPFVIERKQPQD